MIIFQCTNDDGNAAVRMIKYANTGNLRLCPICYQAKQLEISNDPEAFGPIEIDLLLATREEQQQ